MNFSYYDLGHVEKGKIVEVQLSAAANVRLMDSTNYSNYKSGRKHRYYGGYKGKSSTAVSEYPDILGNRSRKPRLRF